MRLELTFKAYDTLHREAWSSTRGRLVKVRRDDLQALLKDHAAAVGELNRLGIITETIECTAST